MNTVKGSVVGADLDTQGPLAVSPSQAAKKLSVSKGHIYRMIRAGELRAARLGNRFVIPVSELHRILEQAR